MTQENKELLLEDLSARLRYKPICRVQHKDSDGWKTEDMILTGAYSHENPEFYFTSDSGSTYASYENVKIYLRPMSNMTKEEEKIYNSFINCIATNECGSWELVNWLNANQFDYHGLIPKGIALEAPKDMYNFTR